MIENENKQQHVLKGEPMLVVCVEPRNVRFTTISGVQYPVVFVVAPEAIGWVVILEKDLL